MFTFGYVSILTYTIGKIKGVLNFKTMLKKLTFVANYSSLGDKMIIIIPKGQHAAIQKFGKPLKVTVEEIIE